MALPVLAPLAPLTTLRLGGPARRLVDAPSAEAVVEAVRSADAAGEPLLLLGGGSNVVIADAGWPGTVVREWDLAGVQNTEALTGEITGRLRDVISTHARA